MENNKNVNKIIEKLKSKLVWGRKPGVKALTINIIVYLILNVIAYARFDNDVDYMMQGLVANVTGTRGTSHVGFSNSLIMKPICILTSKFPNLPWYTWFVVIISFVAICVLNGILLEKRNDKQIIIIVALFDVFVGYECYMYPSYIKASIVGTFSMAMFLINLFNKGKKCRMIIPFLGLIISGMVSFTGFILAIVSFLITSILNICFEKKYKLLLPLCACVIISSALNLGIYLFDRLIMNDASLESDLRNEYINSVEKLLVFGYPEYDKSLEEDYDITEDKYRILSTGNYFFVEERTSDSFKIFNTLANKNMKLSFESLISYLRTIPAIIFKKGLSYLFLIIVFVLLLSNNSQKKGLIWTAILFIIVAYGIAFFNYAWDNNMIQMIVFIPVAYYLMINIPYIAELANKDFAFYLILIGIVLYSNFSEEVITTVSETDINKTLNKMVTDESKTIVFNIDGIYKEYSPYESQKKDLLKYNNVILTNGYYSLFAEYNNNQYMSHIDESLWVNGEDEIDVNDYYVCK